MGITHVAKRTPFQFFCASLVSLLTACGDPVELTVTDISTLTLSYPDFADSLDPAEVQKIPPKGTLVRLAAGRDVSYTIAPQTNGITVNPHGVILVTADVPVNPGGTEYTVTATGAGAYVNTQTATFLLTINKQDLSTVAGFQLNAADKVFTGSDTTHYVDVAGGLTAGTDYQLTISPSISASISEAGLISITGSLKGGDVYEVTAAGINNYTGTVRKSFTLRESLFLTGFRLSMEDYTVFSGDMSLVPAVIDNQKLADYTLSLVDSGGIVNPAGISINAGGWISIPGSISTNDSGEYTVIAAGTGNYGGTVKATFNLTVSDSDFIYNDFFVIATATAHSGGGASWQSFSAPTMAMTPSWKNSPPAGTIFSVPNPSDKPGWLYLDSQTGELSGTPGAIGFGSFIIEAELSGAVTSTTVNWFVGVQPENKDELKTAVRVELARYASMNVTEYQDLRAIDTSLMTDMSDLFYVDSSNQPQYALDFNGDISSWDVSNVTNMSGMFRSKADSMSFTGVFKSSSNSIHSISKWDVSNVTNMEYMFTNADRLGVLDGVPYPVLAEWDVSNVTNMARMFEKNDSTNLDISNWDTSSVTNMCGMFAYAENFNQNISNWNVSSVTDMMDMFTLAKRFDQDISNWNVSNVINMQAMFLFATDFNQNISEWNVGNVADMRSMFKSAASFNQALDNWSVDSSVATESMFFQSGVENLPEWYSP